MDTLGYKGIAVLVMFMGTGASLCPLGVAAAFVVLRVVFAQGAPCWWRAAIRLPLGKGRGREQRKQQAQAQKRRCQSFSHGVSSLVPGFGPLLRERRFFFLRFS